MFFEDDDDDGLNGLRELHQYVSREIFVPQFEPHSVTLLNSIPTHTEDGIPIRKLYVSNLPPKTTRTELFGVFAQYGFIKSCWLRIGEKGPNKCPTATYAFVTYSNPADAYKALEAPSHEKTLHGRTLRISPADSWHQPAQDADGRVQWKPRARRPHADQQGSAMETTSEQGDPEPSCSETDIPEESEGSAEAEESYNILDILNRDCLTHILSYIHITDLIRSERVSKRWQTMIQDYLQSIRTFKTSRWKRGALTTAVLRRVLARAGDSLARLHIDHPWTALNDRTAHTIGKFCPNLEELKVVGMHTKNWNPLIYGCKQLKIISFVSCNKLTDSSLVPIVKNDSCIESLTVANNSHVTGLFLTGSNPPKLNALAFYNCYSLQGTVLCAAIDTLPYLTTLKLDACPVSMWKIIPLILSKLPALRELSLSEYMSVDLQTQQNDDFCDSLANLPELRVLNLFKNIYVTNAVLKQVAQSCTKLESLNISSCNARKTYTGVSDEGVVAVCSGCALLTHLDISYLAALSDAGLRALPRLASLRTLLARGNIAITSAPLVAALLHLRSLQDVDLCGCDNVSEQVVEAARRAVSAHPRHLSLHLASTAVNLHDYDDEVCDEPRQKLVTLAREDTCNPILRPDFVDHIVAASSEESFDDLYNQDDFNEFFRGRNIYFPHSDDEFIDEDDDNDDFDFEEFYAYGIHGQDIILL